MTLAPDVLVLPAFSDAEYQGDADAPDEIEYWLAGFEFERERAIPGLPGPLRFAPAAGLALARTGIGKAAAGASVGALVASKTVDLSATTILTVGIAGCPPAAGPVGSVFVADRVVDWDRKHRVGDDIRPISWRPADYEWGLDTTLAEQVAEAAADATLADSPSAQELRARYDDTRDPTVGVGPTVCGDELWHGRKVARQVEALCTAYGIDGYVTTEMEEVGTVTALDRAGLLEQYASVRAVSNYDRAPPGGDPRESADWIDIGLGAENAYRAGRAVVRALQADA